ncbi:MAG: ABC transporter ATP-binding protein [Anaerolineae bacterium]|nr:ABC transporter ATP-binding protein [Anaerolineae bacterium]
MKQHPIYPPLDLKQTLSSKRLVGMWRLLAGFHWLYLGAILSLALATAARSGMYLLLQYFVDDMLIQKTVTMPFYLIALGFVGLSVFQGGFTFISGKMAARSAEGAILRLRNYLFDHLQRLSFSYHDHAQTGDLVQRCSSDVDTIRRLFAEQMIGVGRIALLFIINWATLLSLNVKLGLFSIMSMPIVLTISILFFRKIHTAYELHQEQEGLLSTTLQENLSGVRVVKAFARQKYEINKFDEVNQGQFQRGRQLLMLHAFFWPISEIISGTQMVFIFVLGAIMAINGEITIGTYMAAAGLVIWIIWPMQNMGRLIIQTSMGLVSYNRISEILTKEQEQLGQSTLKPTKPLRGAIEFRDVSFEYDGSATVLHNVSFQAEPGQTIALLGATGSGKSSLVNLLPRFYDYEGHILLDQIELRDYAKHELRQQIGIVEQEPFLFSRTIRENIAYGVNRQVTDEEVEAAARAAAIHDVIMTFPEGYNTLVGEKGVTLSGGQKQRVTIARTLLKDPRILIFDDAVSSVDTETEAHIHAALERLQKERTTFIIAHRIQTVMQADKILVLDKGRVIQQGNHQDLMTQEGIYRKIYQLQARVEQEVTKPAGQPNGKPGNGRVKELVR